MKEGKKKNPTIIHTARTHRAPQTLSPSFKQQNHHILAGGLQIPNPLTQIMSYKENTCSKLELPSFLLFQFPCMKMWPTLWLSTLHTALNISLVTEPQFVLVEMLWVQERSWSQGWLSTQWGWRGSFVRMLGKDFASLKKTEATWSVPHRFSTLELVMRHRSVTIIWWPPESKSLC